MKKRIFFGIGILLILVICFLLVYQGKAKDESIAVKTAGQFLTSLIEYDIDKAKELSAGSILANLSNSSRIENKPSEYMVVSKTINVICENKDWAELNAEVETKDRKTGVIDVHWYDIYLIKVENNWRVYRIEEIEVLPGKEREITHQDIVEATKIFEQYLTHLSQNKYDKAGEVLIGKARIAHEQTKAILGTAPVIKYFKEIKLEFLYYNEKVLTAKVRYRVDGRNTILAVSFFRTSEGWRIYNVSQI